ncbi:MAG TPA: hypothetical protein DD381_13165 [Lentisphaeria bacterium]|nr:MAG: hypothetical protein A2X47_11640 [Lentisphaerae bacterium GWF2_38_69]HBM17272.1 hypothetical protein [Lentisphaeria bacterium]
MNIERTEKINYTDLVEHVTEGQLNHEKVFFLGSGFSKGINCEYPTLTELSKKIENIYSSDKVEKSLQEHYKTIPDKLKNNIEELLSYLSGKLIWKDEITNALDKALYIDITKESVKHLKDLENKDQDKNKILDYLSKFILETKSPTITLNYDLLIEKALISNSHITLTNEYDYLYQIPILHVANRVQRITNCVRDLKNELFPHVVKLHGSVNWLYQGEDYSNQIYFTDKVSEAEAYINGQYAKRKFNSDLIPFIIPPVLVKDALYENNILKILWIKAHEYLANAKEIYVIGFSFPQTDLYVKFLFQSALKSNKDAKVYVINTDTTKELKCRYRKAIGGRRLNWNFCKKETPINSFVDKIIENNKGS